MRLSSFLVSSESKDPSDENYLLNDSNKKSISAKYKTDHLRHQTVFSQAANEREKCVESHGKLNERMLEYYAQRRPSFGVWLKAER